MANLLFFTKTALEITDRFYFEKSKSIKISSSLINVI
jgi:hypothetical protein